MDLLVSGNYLHLFAFNQCFAKADISGDVCTYVFYLGSCIKFL